MAYQYLKQKSEQSDIFPYMIEEIFKIFSFLNRKYSVKYNRGQLRKREESENSVKTTYRLKEARHKYFEEQREKAQAASQFVTKFNKEYYQKARTINNTLRKLEDMIEEDKRIPLYLKDIQTREIHSRSLQKIHLMHLQKEKRRISQDKLNHKTSSHKFLTQKPLFRKIEERYALNRAQPIRKPSQTSLLKTQIYEHFKWYNEIKNSTSTQRSIESSPGLHTILGKKVYKEDKGLLNLKEKDRKYKHDLAARKFFYSKIIKETFKPEINIKKRQEMQERINNFSRSKLSVKKEIQTDRVWKPRKFPKNPMVAEAPSKKESKTIDYLSELKNQRKPLPDPFAMVDDLARSKDSKHQVKKLRTVNQCVDDHVRRADLIIDSQLPSKKTIKMSQSVNNLLVNSIKSKLNILSNLYN